MSPVDDYECQTFRPLTKEADRVKARRDLGTSGLPDLRSGHVAHSCRTPRRSYDLRRVDLRVSGLQGNNSVEPGSFEQAAVAIT